LNEFLVTSVVLRDTGREYRQKIRKFIEQLLRVPQGTVGDAQSADAAAFSRELELHKSRSSKRACAIATHCPLIAYFVVLTMPRAVAVAGV
jgi:hypothetical protein